MELHLQFFGGRGASGGAKTVRQSYMDEVVKNDYFLKNGDKNSEEYKAVYNATKNLPLDQLYYKSLTTEEQNAITDLQNHTIAINEYMRKGEDGNANLDKTISEVKSAISKYKLTKDIVLYRGIGSEEYTDLVFGGDGGKTTSFKSASTDKSVAEAFAKNQGGYVIEYRISKGSRVADVNGAPRANENEYLLDSGLKYKKKQSGGDRRHIIIYI